VSLARTGAVTLAALCALAAGGCGIRSPDLFLVQRSGAGAHANLTIVVTEEGGVNCNGRPAGRLEDAQIIQARTIQEKLKDPSSEHLSLPPGRESVFAYYLRDERGWVRFHDDSPRQPKVFRELQAFVLATAQNVCHLQQ
jgi:hypothetical protein